MGVDFRSGYIPPGVYVSQDTSATSTAVGSTPTVILLVGPGLGYRTFTDYATFTADVTSVNLTKTGVDESSVSVSVVSDSSIVLSSPGDFSVATSGTTTTVTRPDTGSTLPENQQVAITYRYSDSAYYALNQFSDPQSVFDVYGTPFDTAGNLQSPLSLGAQIAFENGGNVIYCAALNPNQSGTPTLAQQYNNAYALSAANYDINLVVPIFDSSTAAGHPTNMSSVNGFISGLVSHLQDADSAGFPRNAIFGVPDTFDSSVPPDQIAAAFSYRRVVFVWPNRLNYFNAYVAPPNTTVLGGSYLAAACAGVLANNDTNRGLTRSQIYSISGIADDIASQQTENNKNTWSSRGVAVLEKSRSGQLLIRHGVTTDVSSVTSREFSIVRCGDELFNEIQVSLDSAALIGTPITVDTPLAVKGIVTGALETAMADNTIQGYTNLAVRQLALPGGDPTVIEVTFAYQPTYPLNYITVSFTFDLSTGTLTDTTDTSGTSESNADTTTATA